MEKTKGFLKGFLVTLSLFYCLAFALYGTVKSYENTVYTAFGAKKSAIAFTDDGIRILDFEIKI